MRAWLGILGKKRPPPWLSALATIEGYAAGVLLIVVFAVPVSPGTQRQAAVLVSTLIGLGIGFGLAGIRFGQGGSRLAAWSSFVVLSVLSLALGAKAVADWQ
jgi:hypothetical protein